MYSPQFKWHVNQSSFRLQWDIYFIKISFFMPSEVPSCLYCAITCNKEENMFIVCILTETDRIWKLSCVILKETKYKDYCATNNEWIWRRETIFPVIYYTMNKTACEESLHVIYIRKDNNITWVGAHFNTENVLLLFLIKYIWRMKGWMLKTFFVE